MTAFEVQVYDQGRWNPTAWFDRDSDVEAVARFRQVTDDHDGQHLRLVDSAGRVVEEVTR